MEQGLVQSMLYSHKVAFGGSEELPERPSGMLHKMENWQEYLLIIKPGHDIYNKVVAEKEIFYTQYLEKKQTIVTAYITVAGFLAKESMEETLIRWIQRICSRQKSFTVTLNNYSGFPPHTIYLRVQDHEPFQQLAQQLKIINEYIQSNGCPEVKFINRPHLSIAKQLPEIIYEKAIQDYCRKIFFESFIAGELMLIRKGEGSDPCKVINVFGLLPPESNLFN